MKTAKISVTGMLILIILATGFLITSGCAGMGQGRETLNPAYGRGYPYPNADGKPMWWYIVGPQ